MFDVETREAAATERSNEPGRRSPIVNADRWASLGAVVATALIVAGGWATNRTAAPTEEPTPAATSLAPPANTPADLHRFSVAWDLDGRQAEGSLAAENAATVEAAFGVTGINTVDAAGSIEPGVEFVMVDVIAPLAGAEIVEGRLVYDGAVIAIEGIVDDDQTAAAIADRLQALVGVERVELEVRAPELASFTIAWGPEEVEQRGPAPVRMTRQLRLLGVDPVITEPGLGVEPSTTEGLEALASVIGTDLIAGQVTVQRGRLSIEAQAGTEGALERARGALRVLDVDLTLGLTADAEADRLIRRLLADRPIAFRSGTDELSPTSDETLAALVAVLDRLDSVEILVVGHTDDRGNAEANRLLSAGQARSVVDRLADLGVSRTRLEAVGQGELDPIEDNTTAEGRAANRRVEIVVVGLVERDGDVVGLDGGDSMDEDVQA